MFHFDKLEYKLGCPDYGTVNSKLNVNNYNTKTQDLLTNNM